MDIEDEGDDTLTVSEADIAAVRPLPVIWLPIEAGAPGVFEMGKKTHADVEVYRRALRTAEVLIHLGELAPGHYHYDNPLDDDVPSEMQPFVRTTTPRSAAGVCSSMSPRPT